MSEDFISDTVNLVGKDYGGKDEKEAFLFEFTQILENKKNDFPWTAKEMNKLWPLLDKYNRTDAFEELAEIILFEKILHFMVPQRKYGKDIDAWRTVFAHQDPIFQGQTLSALAEKRGKDYLKECETRAIIFLNSFYFKQIDQINVEVKSVFHKAYSNISLKILPTLLNAEQIITKAA